MKSVFEKATRAPVYKITKPLRLIELFAGYGSQAMAFDRIHAKYENWFVCEFDEFAIKSYNAVHGTTYKPIDIRDVHAEDLRLENPDKFTYLMTYSFPCTDISVAGKQKGMSKDSGTRSALLWEVERLLNECGENTPEILLMENVPAILGKGNLENFNLYIKFLESKGYSNHYKVLNAKNFGVPQNRDRCFMFSIKGNYSYDFPEGFPLEKHLADLLEPSVAENFYMNNDKADKLVANLIERKDIPTVKNSDLTRLGNIYGEDKGTGFAGNVWDKQGLSPTLTTMGGGNRQPMIIDSTPCKMVGRNPEHPTSRERGLPTEQRIELKGEDVMYTLTTVQKDTMILESSYRIRKLTPRECYRLMGVTDSDIDKMLGVVSNSQAYKQAGNSIVVDVMAEMFKKLL